VVCLRLVLDMLVFDRLWKVRLSLFLLKTKWLFEVVW